ncbi:VWA domain-containing protein [Candidatus Omnitrophota bacterium]
MRISKKAVVYSLGVSVVAHTMFFACATNVKLPGIRTVLERSTRFFNIESLKKDIPQQKEIRKRGVAYVQALKFEAPSYAESLKSLMDKDKEIEKPALVSKEEKITESLMADKREELDKLIDKEKEKKAESRRDTRKDLVEVADLSDEEVFVRPADSIDEHSDFFDKMPGFTPQASDDILDESVRGAGSGFSGSYTSAIRRKTDYADLNEYLVCGLATYEDPDDGQKYYKLMIRAGRDASTFPRIPKEIVFLVDCSLSTQRERLDQFKKGLRYCLERLNRDDYFNIAAFKDEIIWFRPRSIRPEQSTIEEAIRFVERLSAGAGTDTYNALYESLKVENVIIPSYIVLFSDGRPTYGETDPKKIINKISKQNSGERPIFAFSGGLRVNRYFLDFISYKNRGWTEYAPRSHFIGRQISRFYEKVKDPMLLNLRYRISGLDNKDIFPKALPDFFRDAEFSLYGRYTDEDEFSLQFLGDSGGETNEFIIVGSMKDALIGDEGIARGWAFNRIYYLIGQLEYGKKNEEIIGEINSLCRKFRISIPYSEVFKD